MDKKLTLTTGEAARYCGVNFRTVIRWIERGHLKAYKLPGRGDNRIRVEDFVAFLQAGEMPVPEELLGDQPASQSLIEALVVDDDSAMASAIQRVLKRAGLSVALAQNGFEAGVKLRELQPQLMTLDLKMPTLDGFAVLEYLTNRNIDIKVLVISGESTEKLDRALDCGANDVLAKPFDNAALVAKVEQLLDR